MKTEQQPTATFPQPLMSTLGGARRDVFQVSGKVVQHSWRAVRQTPDAQPSNAALMAEVRDLIEAAGPLTTRDIAGGLDVSVRQAALMVRWMVAHNCVREDEWGRHRLAGPCRT